MSILEVCEVHQFRNLSQQSIALSSGINLVLGENGSGKTSIIEALHHLSVARSFRTHLTREVIAHQSQELIVRGVFSDKSSRALRKSLSNQVELKVGNDKVSLVEFAKSYPAILVYQTIYQLIDSGAKLRRNLLDWGLFHVKHNYLQQLRAYNQVLKQRNALLKTSSTANNFDYWDQALCESGFRLHQARTAYMESVMPVYYDILSCLCDFNVDIRYVSGWRAAETVDECLLQLKQSFKRDLQLGVTHVGAHKADLVLISTDKKAKSVLSRGQQKIALMALKLAQSTFLDLPHLYLIDDLASELDSYHISKVLAYFSSLPAPFQAVITSLEHNAMFDGYVANMFHVKRGEIEIVSS